MTQNRSKKRYQVQTEKTVVKRTDDRAAADQKIKELKEANEKYFRLSDNETGDHVIYQKADHEKNYKVTNISGNPPKVKTGS